MATKRRRPGDFSFGILNDIRDSKTGGKVDSGTGGLTVLRRATRDRYSPKVLQGTGPYRAIVLRIDQKKDGSSKATNPDDASFPAYNVFSPSSTEKDNIPVVAIRARIPELDSHFPIPNKYGDEGSGPHQAKINMHTLFIAQDDLTEVPEPGSVVWVNFGGGPFNRTDPVYLGPVLRTQYAGQAGTIAAGAAGAPRSAFGADCAGSMASSAGTAGAASTSSPLIVNSESPSPRGALVKPARPGGSVSEGEDADPCIVANLKKNLNSATIPIDAWVGSLSGNGQREAIIFIPGTTDLSKKTELIYWIHGAGSYYTNNHSRKLPEEISNMAKQGRNFILIHPAMPWGATNNPNRPCPCKRCVTDQMKAAKCRKVELGGTMAFSDDGACGDLPKMHSEVLAILQNTYKATASEIFITIAVHSKGGYSASPSAKEVPYGFSRQLSNLKPDRITLADADYGFNSTKSIWDKYLSNISKKVEYNILVSNSQVISDKIPNNADQAKKLVRALGHEAPDNHRSWLGKHQVPLEKSAGHTIVYIGGERGGPYNSHNDVGYACISYEHSGGTTVKNNGNPDVESTSRDGLPVPAIEGPPSPDQVEASKNEDFDCVDLQKRLAASEQGLKVTEERVKKYAKEIQALESVDIRAAGEASRQKHNEKLEKVRGRLKGAQENSPTIKQTVEKLKKEAETYRFHPNCRKLEKAKPQSMVSPAATIPNPIATPSPPCGGQMSTLSPLISPGVPTAPGDNGNPFTGKSKCPNPKPGKTCPSNRTIGRLWLYDYNATSDADLQRLKLETGMTDIAPMLYSMLKKNGKSTWDFFPNHLQKFERLLSTCRKLGLGAHYLMWPGHSVEEIARQARVMQPLKELKRKYPKTFRSICLDIEGEWTRLSAAKAAACTDEFIRQFASYKINFTAAPGGGNGWMPYKTIIKICQWVVNQKGGIILPQAYSNAATQCAGGISLASGEGQLNAFHSWTSHGPATQRRPKVMVPNAIPRNKMGMSLAAFDRGGSPVEGRAASLANSINCSLSVGATELALWRAGTFKRGRGAEYKSALKQFNISGRRSF